MGCRIERMTCIATRIGLALALTLVLLTLGVASHVNAGPPQDGKTPDKEKADAPKKDAQPPKDDAKKAPPVKVGLSVNDPKAFQGYTLFCPLSSTTSYLIDMQGKVVRTWESDCSPALCTFLLGDGHVLRGGSLGAEAQPFGPGPGVGGRVQKFTWEGELVWDFKFFNSKQLPHHDLTPMPNGNVLMIVWDRKTAKEAIAAGRRPELTGDSHLLVDSLVEIKPTGKTTGEVVWEWHLWDHLVQDFDKSKPNYGNVAEHPELVNANFGEDALAAVVAKKDGAAKDLGPYVGTKTTDRPTRANPDWTHGNGVSFHADLDQLMISVPHFNEFWIIDHGTTTAEAASHKGGRSGKGGDLLYRWGNPRAYRTGKKEDQRLFGQHHAHWIPKGLPGEGHVLVFNNGSSRPDGNYSSVDEIVLPVDSQGRYAYEPGSAYGPGQATWSYTAPKKTDFYSFFISGAQRLPNGNTLICSGANGTFIEVTPEKEVVWKYVNPTKGGMVAPGGFGPPPQPAQVLTPIVRDLLGLSQEQRKEVDGIQKDVDAHLDKLLTADQKSKLKLPPNGGPGGPGSSFKTGQILTSSEQSRLKLSDEQKKDLALLQKDVDSKVEKILNEEQRKQTKITFAFGGGPPPGGGGPGGSPAGGPPRPGQVVPPFARDLLKLSDEQTKQLDAFQKEADGRLDKLLTDEQKKQLKEPQTIGAPPQLGQFMSPTLQARLKVAADQKTAVQALQKEADALLGKLFTEEQKKQFKEMQANVGRSGPAGGGRGGPGGGPGGPATLALPPGGGPTFRVYRFAATHPGLSGRDLTSGKTIEELQAKESDKKDSTRKDSEQKVPQTKEPQRKEPTLKGPEPKK